MAFENGKWVHAYPAPAIAGFEQIWQKVQEFCIKPPEFDEGNYKKHINTPMVKAMGDACEHLPTKAVILQESQREHIRRRNDMFPKSQFPYCNSNDGLIVLRSYIGKERLQQLTDMVADFFHVSPESEEVEDRGYYLYPPGGYREWHTNVHHRLGWRMYIINVLEEGKSFFRYMDPDSQKLETCWDAKGTVNFFHLGKERPFWHCIKSVDTYRWSFGFVVPDNWQEFIRLKSGA